MKPYLSVVAVSRNDDHGGDPLIRTQIFIDNLALQCEELQLTVEILIIDWNPVAGRPGLATVLEIPKDLQYVSTRVITVPASVHASFKSEDKLHLFQMIGKNVGIRRAQGEFILATNIDVLFSMELMSFLSKRKLKVDKTYRVDRFDIKSGVKRGLSPVKVLEYAWDNPIRENTRFHPSELMNLYAREAGFNRSIEPDEMLLTGTANFKVQKEDGVWQFAPAAKVDMNLLHTNACGDFTLISKQGWDVIGGYAEFEGYSFNIDSLGLIAAHYSGFEEITLLPPLVCFHIEHSIGSGWTPEGEMKLFERMRKNGITSPEWPVLMPLVEALKIRGGEFQINDENWGLINFDLPECNFGGEDKFAEDKLAKIDEQLKSYRVGAIKPQYELDRITLIHERNERDKLKSENPWFFEVKNNGLEAQLFISDEDGNFSESNSLKRIMPRTFDGHISYSIRDFKAEYKLRFDPMDAQGIAKIKSMLIIDQERGAVNLIKDASKLHALFSPLCDVTLLKSDEGLLIFSNSDDPQLSLQAKKIPISKHLTLVFEMQFPKVIQ